MRYRLWRRHPDYPLFKTPSPIRVEGDSFEEAMAAAERCWGFAMRDMEIRKEDHGEK